MARKKADVVGVVLAAGFSKRMEGRDKITAALNGKPVLSYALDLFERCDVVDAVVVVTSSSARGAVEQVIEESSFRKVRAILTGGALRRDSALVGVKEAASLAAPGALVLVHDAARPLTEASLVYALLDALAGAEGAVPTLPITDTVKEVNDAGVVAATLARDKLRAVQTPQAFRLAALLSAYEGLGNGAAVTDDAAVVEMAGGRVVAVAGDVDNFKITYPGDLARAEAVIAGRAAATA